MKHRWAQTHAEFRTIPNLSSRPYVFTKAFSQLWKRNIHERLKKHLINTVFICLPSVKPWANHVPQPAWGGTRKGIHGADETQEKELWEVDTAPSHGEEDEKGHHQAKEPHGLREGKAQNGVGEELLLQRRVPGITNDEAPKHSPNSSPRASHSYCGSPSSNELGCCVNVSWNGTGLEAAARNKWGGQETWGCQAAVTLICQCLWSFQHHCRQWSAQQWRGSPDQGGSGDKPGTSIHFQGMRDCGRRAGITEVAQ